MKTKDFSIILGVLLVCYMYVCDIANFAGLQSVLLINTAGRAPLLTAAVALCFFRLILEKITIERVAFTAFIFGLYMFVIGFNNKGEATMAAFISCVIYWAVLLAIFRGVKLQEKTKNKIITMCACTSILISLIYIYGLITLDTKTVGFSNSIYVVLCSTVFGFIVERKTLRIVLLVTASAAILFSAKTTCIVALIIVLLYFFWEQIFNKKNKHTFAVILVGIIGFLVINKAYEIFFAGSESLYEALVNDLQEDFSGGNGRYNIYIKVWRAFKESSFIQVMFGHGYNAVTNYVGIGAHNDFLQVVFDYGVTGLFLYFAFWIQLIKEAVLVKKSGQDCRAYVISLLIFLCLSMASNVINSQIQMMFLVMFWGINKYTKNNERYLQHAKV